MPNMSNGILLNRKQLRQSVARTSKCGKRKLINEPKRDAKRTEGVMMGRHLYNQLFARVGINLGL